MPQVRLNCQHVRMEAWILLCIHTRCTPTATDIKLGRGGVYLVFEYMDYDLGGLLNRGTEFNVSEIMCISKQMFEGQALLYYTYGHYVSISILTLVTGLYYLLLQNIIHRDLKGRIAPRPPTVGLIAPQCRTSS